ncbi:hypothetical protein V5738_08875 [Salinisphaera sp. SPP-AMP-43]|uniref:helix-turn-helix transcriptional regulator n=1 Tax=Salinisphaera sp. SPP-AMP-43 TaxID=3121288 RepID=UPI003C6E14C1
MGDTAMDDWSTVGDCWLRPDQIRTLLDISESTFYRWQRAGRLPRPAWLVLRSVALGLPVLPSRSNQWRDHRFGRNGALYTPTGYPIYPGDLWLFEFANKNGILEPAKKLAKDGFQGARLGLEAANDDGPRLA